MELLSLTKEQFVKAANAVCGPLNWKPIGWQSKMFEEVCFTNKSRVLMEITRGGGKTASSIILAQMVMHAIPGCTVVFIAPKKTDAEAILEDKIRYFPPNLIKNISIGQGMITFKNGSKFRLMHSGKSQKVQVGRGIEPILAILDEYAWHYGSILDSLEPVTRRGGKIIAASTVPTMEDRAKGKANHYYAFREVCQKADFGAYYKFDADHVKNSGIWAPGHLEEIRESKRIQGKMDNFLQEYYLIESYPTENTIFINISEKNLIPETIVKDLVQKVKKPTWVAVGDTSGSTRWGTLFICLDQDKGNAYLLDCLVRQRISKKNSSAVREESGMTPHLYWPVVQEKIWSITPSFNESNWDIIWDHDTVFMDVIPQIFGSHINIMPAEKKHDKKEEIYSLISDLIAMNRLVISDKCHELIHEMKLVSINTQTKKVIKDGRPDELLDCLKYFIMWYEACFAHPIAAPVIEKKGYWEQRAEDHYKTIFKPKDTNESYDDLLRPEDWWGL